MRPLLTDFRATRPRHEVSQVRLLAWLVDAHVEAETARAELDGAARAAFASRMAAAVKHCACPPAQIGTRGVVIGDIGAADWDANLIYDLRRHPHGQGSGARTRLFAEEVDAYFTTAYADDPVAPHDLIHVTCTGYISPSGAQKLVSRRGWGGSTRVTHAYQMGCYAALPAVRIAAGFRASASQLEHQADIVHTELCSLHLDPTDHRIEQLVVQSLFADGLIRYSMVNDDGRSGLRLLALHERILHDSSHAMAWMVADWGMQMVLGRDVPERVASSLRAFVIELFQRAGLPIERLADSMLAVHPGGPRILDRVRDVLELDEGQLRTSREVLFDHGNMSSATLPHIWMRLVDDARVPRGTLIPSLAFGPGLTVCGGLFEKT
ncbi:MAG: naringenin-chalcone synthase [Deltaproteobacteria bacterium]|nr:naringenin-chalcone synthase [Deltaproteobacteria bacterium]